MFQYSKKVLWEFICITNPENEKKVYVNQGKIAAIIECLTNPNSTRILFDHNELIIEEKIDYILQTLEEHTKEKIQ